MAKLDGQSLEEKDWRSIEATVMSSFSGTGTGKRKLLKLLKIVFDHVVEDEKRAASVRVMENARKKPKKEGLNPGSSDIIVDEKHPPDSPADPPADPPVPENPPAPETPEESDPLG